MRMEGSVRNRKGISLKKVKLLRCFGPFVFSALLVVLTLFSLGSISTATVQDVTSKLEEAPPPAPTGIDVAADADPDPLWRSSLWEALPTEWLSDPQKGTVLEAYQRNGWKPVFIDERFEIRPTGLKLLQRLNTLKNDAIDPEPYHLEELQQSIQNLDQQRQLFQALNRRLYDKTAVHSESGSQDSPSVKVVHSVHYASNSPAALIPDISPQKLDVQRIDEILQAASHIDIQLVNTLIRFAQEMHPFSRESQIKVLAGEITIDEFLKSLVPSSPHYEILREGLKKYEHLAGLRSQIPINEKATLRQGDRGIGVSNLQKRLHQEGFYDGRTDGYFDGETLAAVQRYQRAHLQEPDGAVGVKTRDWLNVSFKQKADMIAQSMKALRQSESRRYDRFVWINIPQFMLEYYDENRLESTHRVIIGKASGKKVKFRGQWVGENHTPPLTSSIENVIFNPRWYVSDRIRRELSDEIASDPNYLLKNGYVKMSSLYPWGEPRLFQLPGPKNPLGQVKFEFPNAYAIFLHDTPKKSLFNRTRRDFSHGCIRMEDASEFARHILYDDQNPSAEKIGTFLKYNHQVVVKLQRPVPIVIDYVPVTSAENNVLFCGNIYGRD